MMYISQVLPQIFALVLAVASVPAGTAFAQEDCGTVKECAEDMVALANELKAENTALLARITALEAALAQQARDNAAALESRIARLKAGSNQNPHPGGNGQSGLCPKNTYMVGARWQVDGGGPHGIMSWFGPICRTMP
jgi:hypothetical protein